MHAVEARGCLRYDFSGVIYHFHVRVYVSIHVEYVCMHTYVGLLLCVHV